MTTTRVKLTLVSAYDLDGNCVQVTVPTEWADAVAEEFDEFDSTVMVVIGPAPRMGQEEMTDR